MIGIGFRAEHADAADGGDCRTDRFDGNRIASFGKIRNTLDQLEGHRTSDRRARISPFAMTKSTRLSPK